jgi:hypothetical protein
LLSDLVSGFELRPDRFLPPTYFNVRASFIHISDPSLDLNLRWRSEQKRKLKHLLGSQNINNSTLSFHTTRDYEEVLLDSQQRYTPLSGRLEPSTQIENAIRNCDWVRNCWPEARLAVENPNYYETGAYDIVSDPVFISELILQTDCHLLLDLAHGKIAAKNRGENVHSYFSDLPLARTIQVHLSKPSTRTSGEWFDAHSMPDSVADSTLAQVWTKIPRGAAVTLEHYRDLEAVCSWFLGARKDGIEPSFVT